MGILSTETVDSSVLFLHALSLSPTAMEVALVLLSAASVHVSLSPPNPPVNDGECCFEKDGTNVLFEGFVHSITWCSKIMMWIGSLYNLRKTVCQPYGQLSSRNEGTHPFVIFGAACVVCGAALRLWCFKSLGPLFTFEITIRPEHELITHGPYAWVRHPSYTGVYLTLGGATLVLIGPGTWMGECGMKMPLGVLFSCLWLTKCVFAFRGMHVRYQTEDEVLREAFGRDWEDYASRVPHKFIPGIL